MKLFSLKTFLSLFLFLFTFPLSAKELEPFKANGKYGYKDESGKIVIPTQFDDASNFSEGLARVIQNCKCGYIDKSGKIVIPAQFDGAGAFSEGLAEVEQNWKWGYIDKNGKMVIPIQFDNAGHFLEGFAPVKQKQKWGYIDKSGEIVIPVQFDGAWAFWQGLARVHQGWKYFYIDKQGRRYSTMGEGKEFLAWEAQQEASRQTFVAQKPVENVSEPEPVKTVAAKSISSSGSQRQVAHSVDYADKMVDVDAGIPAASSGNYSTYAVVIGNEQYLNVTPVANAANDGNVMRQYLVKTLGLPESNILYFENASSAVMDNALSVLEKKASAAAGVGKKFNVIFYYSGHGVPTEDTQEAYLLPVDVSPSNLRKYGMPLSDVYRRLGTLGAECVTVFLDACFTGAGRDNRMLAEVKGVQLEPKKSAPTGNMVVLSACSGRETVNIYKEGKHGLFTYWLLRKLKETNGNVTLGELEEYLSKYVNYTAMNRLNLENGQKPTVQVSPTMATDWRTIRMR